MGIRADSDVPRLPGIDMKVFVAGASGVIGRLLVARLVAFGHAVVGMTRSEQGSRALRALGAEPVVADALDAVAVEQAVLAARPEIVIEQLTALPRQYTPEAMRQAMEANSRIRTVGGANVQGAAEKVGARRYITQSGSYYYAPGPGLATEETGFAMDGPPLIAGGVRTLAILERRVLGTSSLEGIVLRYGFFYGPGTWYAKDGSVAEQVRRGEFPITGNGAGVWSFIHIEDAVAVTLVAMTQGSPGVYNIADDQPSSLAVWLPAYARWVGAPTPPQLSMGAVRDPDALFYATQLRGASNAKAKHELGFQPRPLDWLAEARVEAAVSQSESAP